MPSKKKTPWYAGGLHFECMQCGGCCSGPGEGFIWVSRPEVEIIADFLEISPGEFRRRYLRRIGLRSSIIEHDLTKDCIFLENSGGRRTCCIYPVRPSQCRSWPFWPVNLAGEKAWNTAAKKCSGINRGRLYTADEIEKLKKLKRWWEDENQPPNRK